MARGGKRPGAGRKPDDDAARLRRAARELCNARLEELGRLALKAKNEWQRTAAFECLFKVAYGKELREAIPNDDTDGPYRPREKIEVEWATDPADAIPDPADQ